MGAVAIKRRSHAWAASRPSAATCSAVSDLGRVSSFGIDRRGAGGGQDLHRLTLPRGDALQLPVLPLLERGRLDDRVGEQQVRELEPPLELGGIARHGERHRVARHPAAHPHLRPRHQVADRRARQGTRRRAVPGAQRRLGEAAVRRRLLDRPAGERDRDARLVLALVHEPVVGAHAIVEPHRRHAARGMHPALDDGAARGQRGQQCRRPRDLRHLVRRDLDGRAAERQQLGLGRHAVARGQLGDEHHLARVEVPA